MIGHIAFQQGVALIPQGRPQKARVALEKALIIFEEMVVPEMTGLALEYLSDLTWGMGQLDDARRFLDEHLERARNRGDVEYTIKAMHKLSRFLIETASNDEARSLYRSALALLPQLHEPYPRAEALDALGNMALLLGEYGPARKHFEENYALFAQAENRPGQAWSLRNFGLISYELGDYAAAEKHFQASLDIHRQVSLPWAQAMIWQNLGQVAAACGDLARAEKHYREGLAQAQGLWGTSLSLELLASWGIMLFKLEEPEQAYEHLLATTHHPTYLPMLVNRQVRDKVQRLLAELDSRLPREITLAIKNRGRTADDLMAEILQSS